MPIHAPRGTKDILPDAITGWRYIEETIRTLCRRYGFQEIRTPMFEHTELFQRGIGEGTDVVDKEMYTFTDRSERSLTLRPENTASVVRAYLQNKLYGDSSPQKLFYIGSMFRYDRPQAGRQREFHQFGVELLGEASPLADAEIIMLAVDFLSTLGLRDLALHINSVGCPKCRPVYRQALQDYFEDKRSELCDDCNERFERSPLRILDCKIDAGKPFMEDAPNISDCLCDDCRTHFDRVKGFLNAAGIDFAIDPRLVRGLDYYTKTAFEVKYAPLGAQSAVAGGGRYDGLIEEIGGNPTPAVGFAAGLERILIALEKQELLPNVDKRMDAFVVTLGEETRQPAFRLLAKLRKAGLRASMDYAERSMKTQMKQANKVNARFALILGEDEIKENVVMLKDMEKSEQRKVSFDSAIKKMCVEVGI
ncbi:histidine--tRNA ligase [uncultured Mitsuokella sp.]|uniref:histidine--tRNA ligase n=1 Tax=uncultured Mitsuokella sp. TaxID=453120 RepID=UPI00262BADA0|nr:histidine--tRNA ligase [uncultured Mitsuokella sp.]